MLDFGCIRRFDPAFVRSQRELIRVVVEDRRSDLPGALREAGMVADMDGFDLDLHWRLLCRQYAPYRSPEYEFTPRYLKEAMALSGPTNPNLRKLSIRPEWIWLQRRHGQLDPPPGIPGKASRPAQRLAVPAPSLYDFQHPEQRGHVCPPASGEGRCQTAGKS